MKTLFTGSDILYLREYHPLLKRRWLYIFFFRLYVRMTDLICESHYCVSQRLADELKAFGVKKRVEVLEWPVKHSTPIIKITHKEINILYRKFTNVRNQKFYDWLCSYDIFLRVKKQFPEYNFIELDDTMDLSKIFPLVDIYIRFNRWDGGDPPRLVRECQNNNIKVYYTVGEPDFDKICGFLRRIKCNT